MSINPEDDPGAQPGSSIERKMGRLYRAPEPGAEFAARLEMQLAERAQHPSPPPRWRAAWNWTLGAAGFALLIAFIIFSFSFLPQPPNAMPQVDPTLPAVVTPAASLAPTNDLLAGDIFPVATAGPLRYKVASGDTCAVIAYSFGISLESLIALNGLDPECTDLTDRQELLIPQPTASAALFTPAPTQAPLTYQIVEGDTLYEIAKRFGVSAASLFELNGMQSGDILLPGSELLIPVLAVPTLEPGAAPYALSRSGSQPVNLRSGPGTQFPVVGSLSGSEKLVINTQEPRGEWIPVDYPDAPQGIAWVWSQLVMVVDAGDQNAAPAPTVQVSASNPRRDGDTLLVDVCFELPDNRDWMVQDALVSALSAGKPYQAPINAASLISLQPAAENGAPGKRCDAVEFSLPPGAEAVTPTLQVLALEAPPREGETCTTYLDQVQSSLDRKTTGIRVACEEAPQSFGSWTISAKPESLSQADAEAIVYQAFKDAITIEGPWVFELVDIGGENGIPNLEEQQPLVAELRALAKLRSETFYPKPGWLHLLAREIAAEPGTAPDGSALPAEYQTDEWFYFDAAGTLRRSLMRLLDLSGAVLYSQVNAAEDAVVWEGVGEPPSMDYSFTDLAISRVIAGGSLTREPVTVDGKYIGEKYILRDDQVRWEAMYDQQTGQLLSLLTWEIIPEGLKLAHSVVILKMEPVAELPPEVESLLADGQ